MAHPSSAGSDVATAGGGVKLPASLRIGAENSEGSRSPPRGGSEMWMNFQKDEEKLPESLRPGAGVMRTKTPEGRTENVSMHGALETDPEVNPWSREKGTPEVKMHGGLNTGDEGREVGMYGNLPKSLVPGGGGARDAVDQDAWMHGPLPATLPFSLPSPGEEEPPAQSIPMHSALPTSSPASLPVSLVVGGGDPARSSNASPWAVQSPSSSDCE